MFRLTQEECDELVANCDQFKNLVVRAFVRVHYFTGTDHIFMYDRRVKKRELEKMHRGGRMFTLQGRIWKGGKFWLVEVPALDIATQGRTKDEAYEMMKDAIETHVHASGFSVSVTPQGADRFTVSADADSIGKLVGLLLRRQRAKQHLSLEDMRVRLGSGSRSNYAQYEKGNTVPGLIQLSKFVEAMGVQAMLCFNLAHAAKSLTHHRSRSR